MRRLLSTRLLSGCAARARPVRGNLLCDERSPQSMGEKSAIDVNAPIAVRLLGLRINYAKDIIKLI